jgi:solute carrier family 35 protein C2
MERGGVWLADARRLDGSAGNGTAGGDEASAGLQFVFLASNALVLFGLALACRLCRNALVRGVVRRGCERVLLNEHRRELAIVALDIAQWSFLWFGFSVSMTLYNHWLFLSFGFAFPALLSFLHMLIKWLLSWLAVRCLLGSGGRPRVPRAVWWFTAVPVGVSTALDICSSNASMLYVSVAFFTVVKSAGLVFTLCFAVLYRLKRPRPVLVFSVLAVSSGIAISSSGELDFSWLGFSLVVGAAAVGGLRWCLTEILMQQLQFNLDAVLTILVISPSAVLSLLPFALSMDGARFVASDFFRDPRLLALTALNVLGSGLFSFAMILVELELLRRTSSLTLGVISYAKQAVQIGMSVALFHDRVTARTVLGFLITVLGMAAYTWMHAKPIAEQPYIKGNDGLYDFGEVDEDDLADAGEPGEPIPDFDFEELDMDDSGGGRGGRSARIGPRHPSIELANATVPQPPRDSRYNMMDTS